MPRRGIRAFCRALSEEIDGRPNWFVPMARVAERMGLDERQAILLADQCVEAGYVRLDVKGPPYRELPGAATLTEEGRQHVEKSPLKRGRRN